VPLCFRKLKNVKPRMEAAAAASSCSNGGQIGVDSVGDDGGMLASARTDLITPPAACDASTNKRRQLGEIGAWQQRIARKYT
jgi:hypothetical protein